MNTLLTGSVEAVQRKALNVVDWRFRSPTSSRHPYRSSQLAALFGGRRESAAERRGRRREAPPRAAAH